MECPVCKMVFKDLHRSVHVVTLWLSDVIRASFGSLKCGHSFCAACLKQWFQSCWTRWVAHKRPPVGLTSRNISTLPLSSAVITAVRRCFGHVPFTCPTCRDLVGKHQPYKVIALGQLSDALSSLGGEQGEEDPSTDWTGYFSV
jgi:hypothetical protein